MGLEAVFWDFDGSMIDSERLYHIAANNFFKKFNYEISREEYIKRWMVDGTGAAGLLRHLGVDYPADKGAWERRKFYKSLFNSEDPIRPGALRLINELSKKVKLGIVSGSMREDIDFILEKYGIGGKFDVIVSREDNLAPKPSPKPYKQAAGILDIKPNNIIAIEDSTKGVEAAKSAGMVCVAIPNDYTWYMDLAKADHIFTSLKQVNLKKLQEVYSNGPILW